jgi:hypothetical protein
MEAHHFLLRNFSLSIVMRKVTGGAQKKRFGSGDYAVEISIHGDAEPRVS